MCVSVEDLKGWDFLPVNRIGNDCFLPPCIHEAETREEIQEEVQRKYIPEQGGIRLLN